MKNVFISIVCILSLSACSTLSSLSNLSDLYGSKKDEVTKEEKVEEVKEDPTAEEFFTKGKDYISRGRYEKAITQFEEIERLYPFSSLASDGQVMVAYSLYKNEEYDSAIDTVDAFAKLNPAHKDIAYMYYLKAVSYYERIADIKRDQAVTEKSLKALQDVQRRFPESYYARDAKLKEDLVYDHLAGKEVEIGRFYLKSGKFIAAVNRFKVVVDDYDRTPQVKEALYRLVESYLSLGLFDEAKKHAALLGHNYPDSKWYKYAYRLVEEGENAPKAKLASKSWFRGWLSGDKEDENRPKLSKDNKADSWIRNIFKF